MCDGGISIKCYDLFAEDFPMTSSLLDEYEKLNGFKYEPVLFVDIARISNWDGEELGYSDMKIKLPLYLAKIMAKRILDIEGPDEIKAKGAGFYPDRDGGFTITLGDKE